MSYGNQRGKIRGWCILNFGRLLLTDMKYTESKTLRQLAWRAVVLSEQNEYDFMELFQNRKPPENSFVKSFIVKPR